MVKLQPPEPMNKARSQRAAYCVDIYGWFCELQSPSWVCSQVSRSQGGQFSTHCWYLPGSPLVPRLQAHVLLHCCRTRSSGCSRMSGWYWAWFQEEGSTEPPCHPAKLASAHHETLPSSSRDHLSHWEQPLTLERKRAESTSSLKPWSWMISPEERERAGRRDERN